MSNQKIVRLPDVINSTGLSRSTIYAMRKNGNFPQSVKLGVRAVGWYEADIQDWLASRQASKAV